jgi:hypothetical protein
VNGVTVRPAEQPPARKPPEDELVCRPPATSTVDAGTDPGALQSTLGNGLTCRILGAAGPAQPAARVTQLIDEIEGLARFARPAAEPHGKRWARMSAAEIDANARYQEKRAEQRDRLVTLIGEARSRIAHLTAEDVKASLYQRLNTLTPYYTQMGNINVLYTDKEAWARTCNVTSVAMALEALGVKIGDFTGDANLMARIAAAYQIPSVSSLRMPDFLQLVAIYVAALEKDNPAALLALPDDEFAGRIARARQLAATPLIVQAGSFARFTALLGVMARLVTHENESTLTRLGELGAANLAIARDEERLAETTGGIGRVGKHRARTERRLARDQAAKSALIRRYTEEDIRAVAKGIERLEKRRPKRPASAPAVPEDLDRQRARLAEMRAAQPERIAHFEEELDVALPVDVYRDSLVTRLQDALATGRQVVGNRVSHFVRIESVSEAGLVIDDPADLGKDYRMTWEEARSRGFFRRFVILER